VPVSHQTVENLAMPARPKFPAKADDAAGLAAAASTTFGPLRVDNAGDWLLVLATSRMRAFVQAQPFPGDP
jgi:hypothetical protein